MEMGGHLCWRVTKACDDGIPPPTELLVEPRNLDVEIIVFE